MMSLPKPIPCVLPFFLVILFVTFKLSSCMIENHISHSIPCPEIEKQALVSFKQSVEDPFGQLSSWSNSSTEGNCCNWKGVVCNNFTGHVQQLRLHLKPPAFLSGKISLPLLNLTQLRYLDLSNNNFTGRIPSFVGSLRSLQYLNLSNAGFHGSIPHSVGNLSNLHTLALGTEEDTNSLYANSLEWLSRLSKLMHLSMNRVNLSEAAANWAAVINSLPSLEQVHLNYCNLSFITDSLMNEVNLSSSLTVLELSSYPDDNELPRSLNLQEYIHQYLSSKDGIFLSLIPRWIFRLSNLVYLDLSGNNFEGPIPIISNTTKLQHIDLSHNYFTSTIPDWLYSCKDLHSVDLNYNGLQGTISSAIANLSSLNTLNLSVNELSGNIPREITNLCKMQALDLSFNKLHGELLDSFGNMSDCFLDSLQFLDLHVNQLSGHITENFGEFKSLSYLSLAINLLSGSIPSNLGHLMSLRLVWLSGNQLSGNLPESLGQLFNLEYLIIRGNKLEGVVTESHFANLTKLIYLDASGNHQLTLKVNPNWIPAFQLEFLRLISWDLGTKNIPSWLKKQKNLDSLELSSTGISGLVPNWIWGISNLILSNNHLHGKIPDKFGNNTIVNLSSNRFSGSLPRVGDLILALNLSNNAFSGGLSHFLCGEVVPNRLEILSLLGNQLTGELPDCFMNWPSLKVLSLGNNNLSGSIPDSIRFLTNLRSLDLQSNKFSGRIPFSMHKCLRLDNINLAHNNIEGNIPKWMGMSLPDLKFFILRSNKLSGQISSNICLLNSLQILDLSDNNFSGMIPRCVDNFTAMANKKSESEVTNTLYLDSVNSIWFFRESAIATTKGQESQYSTILGLVTNMDLSNNNLSGDIPKGLTSLVELGSLNLSGNQLTGLIPLNIGDMKQLESLDLSRNSLSGGIPGSLATITSLGYLNLSNNTLTGKIPEGPQISGFDPTSFMGNHLCGPQVKVNCNDDDEVPEPANNGNNQGNKSEIDWFYVFLSSGFATGFSVVCSTLIFNKPWRDAYFGFVEAMCDKLYVFFYVKWRMWVRR